MQQQQHQQESQQYWHSPQEQHLQSCRQGSQGTRQGSLRQATVAGYHLGYSHYYGKSEAEPKADPYLLYGGYGHLGYAGHYGYPYAHHGLAYYGKRSADAEPKADPYLLYGGYGHLGYAGHYGYPYSTYSYYG